MRVLLISPHQYLNIREDFLRLKPPLGIALLKQNTPHDVTLFDALAEGYNNREINGNVLRAGATLDKIKAKVEEENPEIIGISNLWSANYPAALEIADYVKHEFPDKIVVMGGVHPSFAYPEIIKEESVDYIAIRESTESFPQFIEFIEGKREWKEVSGFVRFRDGRIEQTKPAEAADLKRLIPIDYRIFPLGLYGQQKKFGEEYKDKSNADIVTSVGCPHNCDFCSTKRMWPGKVRTFSDEQMDFMLESIVNAGYNFVSVQDDNLAANPRHAKKLIQKLAERNLPWHWEGGAEIKLLPHILNDLCSSTCRMVDMAIETANKQASIYDKFSVKGDIEELLHEELKALKKAGIFVNASFMLGLPGESAEDMNRTVEYARKLKDNGLIDHANFHLTVAYPGTKLGEGDYEKPGGRKPSDYFGYAACIGNIPNLGLSRKKLIEIRNQADIYVNGIETYRKKRTQLNRY